MYRWYFCQLPGLGVGRCNAWAWASTYMHWTESGSLVQQHSSQGIKSGRERSGRVSGCLLPALFSFYLLPAWKITEKNGFDCKKKCWERNSAFFSLKFFPRLFLQEFVVKFAKSSAAGSLNSQQCIKSRGRKFPRNEACFVQKFASNLFHDTRRENRILLSTQDLARKISPNICKTRNFRNTHFLCLEQHKGRKIASLKERRAKSESVQFLPFFAAELRSQGISFFSPFSGLFSATAWLLPRVWMSVCPSLCKWALRV